MCCVGASGVLRFVRRSNVFACDVLSARLVCRDLCIDQTCLRVMRATALRVRMYAFAW